MKTIFTTLIISFICISALAQERTISGQLTDDDGEPLPGISIVIKGTNTGTVTDINGYYTITAPIGSTLVFSFVGMATKEVIVTGYPMAKKRDREHHLEPLPPSFYMDTTSASSPGTAVLDENTPTYYTSNRLDPSIIKNIERNGDHFVVKNYKDPFKRSGYVLNFSSSFSLSRVFRLPDLQNNYAQGRPENGEYVWRGADQGEIFSWGPAVQALEYDGSNYAYDTKGRLVKSGSGNGIPAGKYDPTSIFKNAVSLKNDVSLSLPAFLGGILDIKASQETKSGILPNNSNQTYQFSTGISDASTKKSHFSADFHYSHSEGKLLQRGSNWSNIIGSIYRTPVTFDNANGLNNPEDHHESYLTEIGRLRNHAPGLVDNPYGIVNQLPDNEKINRTLSSLSYSFNDKKFGVSAKVNLDVQSEKRTYGIPLGYASFTEGRFTNRKSSQAYSYLNVSPYYDFIKKYGNTLKLRLSYINEYWNSDIHRTDGYGLSSSIFQGESADSLAFMNQSIDRIAHEPGAQLSYENSNEGIYIKAGNNLYFSNTLTGRELWLPQASVKIKLNELLYLGSIHNLSLYGSYNQNVSESPLVYQSWAHQSTILELQNYNHYYESSELFFDSSTRPQRHHNFEAGTQLYLRGISFSFDYFQNMTKDYLAPVYSNDNFQLQNVADLLNKGINTSLGYFGYFAGGDWSSTLHWSTFNTIAKKVYDNKPIPIGGFKTVQSVIAEVEQLGAIYGTSYLRNDNGEILINNDGFPIENQQIKKIGNPLPDWILGWSTTATYGKFSGSMVWEWSKGGDIYNGTKAILDYLGRSETSGNDRNTSNYIFPGATEDGSKNITPVNFSNPELPVTENRWVRYGWDGVGESYIEDASSLRLSSLQFTYRAFNNHSSFIKRLELHLTGHNLLLFAPYKGSDPQSHLYGQTAGLDVFNAPPTRSYHLKITANL
ncbi:carboxypeptidase-like regulatory domain-containing protein [Fulvivirga ligni]|uniref:carboxypeptidase-like regulatory domain-containing protein n=1 Tax=Fulvivirga ligni TaxID=2904246 RepID=UPI001F33F772|nr:carboxypeptidase-like regulatory domain-containing protein [Fulvivirga ligni]UII24202.1 TonB-dependent receptor [Fulvivirga ligni]